MNLDHKYQYKNYIDVLQKYLKKQPVNIGKMEDEINHKIYSGNLQIIANVAYQREEKLFVLVATSKSLQQLWVDM
jgi:hypothetical protein